jgi:hydrogenase maturation protein HypF
MVYRLATALGLKGFVENTNDGVHIFFNADNETAEEFLNNVKNNTPLQSRVLAISMHIASDRKYNGFTVVTGNNQGQDKKVRIAADKAICDDCKIELQDPQNRRYQYPFITCTQCGPRYSIINNLPFERAETSMQPFVQCNNCQVEYDTISDRRFYSQTNSCAACGISLWLADDCGQVKSEETGDIRKLINQHLQSGKILAVKGIGGYLLLCEAGNTQTVNLLRSRKHRPHKPFALLYPNLMAVQNSFYLNDREASLLESEEAPIVLLYPLPGASAKDIARDAIAPGLHRLGVMLPYSPLLQIIAGDFGKPLVATSANIAGSPIIYKDADALEYLNNIADFTIGYNRDIVVPQDDSVALVSRYRQQTILLRRSRGYAPNLLQYLPLKNTTIIAMGALLKSSFSLSVNGNVFVSQFLGNGESYESQQMYKDCLMHWMNLYEIIPKFVINDLHPNYFSHRFGVELAANNNAVIHSVQHHEAHFAAVLAENDWINATDAVLGVIWDGTGLGRDGNIWGGEFFSYSKKTMQRVCHFDYFPLIAGDKTALEPRLSALCTLSPIGNYPAYVKDKFTTTEWKNYLALIASAHIFSSAVGRVFDAVASLLNVCNKQTFEGAAAMQLQSLAEDYVAAHGFKMDAPYITILKNGNRIDTTAIMQGIITDIKFGRENSYIAAKLHYSLVCCIGILAREMGVSKICFSGGVFQNSLLVDWIENEFANIFELGFHKNLSPNDENISFGQLVYFDNDLHTV